MSAPEPTVHRAYFDLPDGQIHYRICRPEKVRRPALFLFHPTPKSGWIYERIMPHLATGGRIVIAPDTTGYGASDPPEPAPTIASYAATNFALADHLIATGVIGEEPFDLLGYHTGSVTATEMGCSRPDRVGRIVLISLPAYDAATRAERLARLADWPGPSPDGSHLTAMWTLVGQLSDPRASIAWRHRSVAENLRAAETSAGYGAVYRYDMREALGRLSRPVLVLNPQDDLWQITGATRHIPLRATYLELPGTGHGLLDFQAVMLSEIIRDYLDKLS